MPKPDKDSYLAWREHPVTKWVLGCLMREAAMDSQQIQELLFNSLSQAEFPPLPPAAYRAGRVKGLLEIVLADYEDLIGDDDGKTDE